MARRRPSPSTRQIEVLRARCQTGSRKGAALQLGISESTVRFHLERMFLRCGCVDEAQACFVHARDIASLSGRMAT